MSSRKVYFKDAANPKNVSSGSNAAYYVNGFAWPRSDIERMAAVFGISVLEESFWAQHARCLDIENGAARIPSAVPFVIARREFLRHEFGKDVHDDSTCYVNRSNWEAVRQSFSDAHEPEPLYWVATLDGTWELEGAWAVQGQGGINAPYDLSVIHGVYNLHRP